MPIKIVRVQKRFKYQGLEFRIVKMLVPYMNAQEPIEVQRGIAPNNGTIPVKIQKGDTLKNIQARTITMFEAIEELGHDIKKACTKQIPASDVQT